MTVNSLIRHFGSRGYGCLAAGPAYRVHKLGVAYRPMYTLHP